MSSWLNILYGLIGSGSAVAGMEGLAGGGGKKTEASSSAFSRFVFVVGFGLAGLGVLSGGSLYWHSWRAS